MNAAVLSRTDTQIGQDVDRALAAIGVALTDAPAWERAEQLAPLDAPLHVYIDVVIEQIAVIGARLLEMERAEQTAEGRAKVRAAFNALRAMRHGFDPYSEAEVRAVVAKANQYARSLLPAEL